MNPNKISIIALTVISLSSPEAQSATAEEACATMTNKLSVMYSIHGYPKSFYLDKRKVAAPRKTADDLVSLAYGTTRRYLDKDWPGFFEWSSSIVLQSILESRSPGEFRSTSLAVCIATYE